MRLLLTALLAVLAAFAPVSSFAKAEITALPGYTALGLAPGFEDFLKKHPATVEALAKDPEASRTLFTNATLQKRLMDGDITIDQITGKDYDFSESAIQAALDKAHQSLPDNSIAATRQLSDITKPQPSPTVTRPHEEKPNDKPHTGVVIPPVEHTSPTIPPVSPVNTTTPEPESIDINSRPSAALLTADEKGWPKYLHVPASCAAKESGRNYIHEFVSYDFKRHGTGLPNTVNKTDTIKSYFRSGGNPWEMYLNAQDIIAAPFVYQTTSDDLSFGYFANAHEASARRGMIWSISDCPDDFGTVLDLQGPDFSAGGNRLGTNCVAIGVGEWRLYFGHGNLNHPEVCKLEPGKRYFLNVKSFDMTGEFEPECVASKCYINGVGIIASNIDRSTPYVGPCYDAAPYPLNYNSLLCGQSFGRACTTANIEDLTCYDLTGQKAPVHLVNSCAVGTKAVWTEGFGKPIYASMMCEVTGTTQPNAALCAAHRKGQIRRAAAYNQQGTLVYEKVETCVFEGGRYFWKVTRGGGNAYLDRNVQIEHTLSDPE